MGRHADFAAERGSLLIGDEVEVTVLAMEAGWARLAIQAP